MTASASGKKSEMDRHFNSLAAVERYLPLLQELGIQALKAGAKIYLMSIELNLPDFTTLQFGSALPEFLAMKSQHDPKGLLNPGLFA